MTTTHLVSLPSVTCTLHLHPSLLTQSPPSLTPHTVTSIPHSSHSHLHPSLLTQSPPPIIPHTVTSTPPSSPHTITSTLSQSPPPFPPPLTHRWMSPTVTWTGRQPCTGLQSVGRGVGGGVFSCWSRGRETSWRPRQDTHVYHGVLLI